MEEKLAYCGGICHTCAIYLATREKDQTRQREMRAKIAQQIKELYGQECKAEDVGDCDGCKTEGGRLFSNNDCPMRICAIEEGIESGAHCDDYLCEALEKLFTTDPGARERLDMIKGKI